MNQATTGTSLSGTFPRPLWALGNRWVMILGLVCGATSAASSPAPPRGLRAFDTPYDGGRSITLTWKSAAGEAATGAVQDYEILRAASLQGPYTVVATVAASTGTYSDTSVSNGKAYFYLVRARGATGIADSERTGPAQAKPNWFNPQRVNILAALVLFLAFLLYFIREAMRGKSIFVRRIPGLTAIEEAIGRSTEMGKPVLYVPGIDDMNNIQTVASMVILGDVAKITARYETPLIVPICRPFVVPVAEETVKQGYNDAGRPDAYNPDNIRYLSDEQFAFTAGVNGIMLARPAANIFLGSFFAESLVLAETGFSTGAIQVAGTANVHQLPFFVAARDFTLIGEELYAASAYLSKEPKLLGTLKGSDLAKLVIMIVLVMGTVFESSGVHFLTNWFVVR